MPSTSAPRIALAPEGAPAWMAEAITAGGGHLVGLDEAQALIWGNPFDADSLASLLAHHPDLEWIQLPHAGIERFAPFIDDRRVWTCAKGVYAEPVAEMALTLALAGLRGVGDYARQKAW